VFGKRILALTLKKKIEAIGVDVKRQYTIGKMAGFGSSGSAVELLFRKQSMAIELRY
jgi:hypothetical protein